MTMVVSKYLVFSIPIAAFFVGMTMGQFVAVFNPLLNFGDDSTAPSEVSTMNQRIEELSSEINAMRISPDAGTVTAVVDGSDIAGLEKDIKVINVKLDRLQDYADETESLESEIEKLKSLVDEIGKLESELEKLRTAAGTMQPQLRADLDKAEYEVGDSVVASGAGLPNMQVRILLLDPDGLTISERSATSDSAGNFMIVVPLSKSLSSGTYAVRISQAQELVEREFRIADAGVTEATPLQELTLSVDRTEVERGDTVTITGKTDANAFVDFDIFDGSNVHITRTLVKADASGNFTYLYTIDSDRGSGTYTVRATHGDEEASITFDVVTASSTTPSSSASGQLTITTDKSEYGRGDLVIITGKAEPNSKVAIFVEPPAGDDFILTINAGADGSYRTLFAVKTNASTGMWNLSVKQDSDPSVSTTTTIFVA